MTHPVDRNAHGNQHDPQRAEPEFEGVQQAHRYPRREYKRLGDSDHDAAQIGKGFRRRLGDSNVVRLGVDDVLRKSGLGIAGDQIDELRALPPVPHMLGRPSDGIRIAFHLTAGFPQFSALLGRRLDG